MPPSTTAIPKLVPYSNAKQTRSFLLGQLFGTIQPLKPSELPPDLPSRTIIITGSNTGLGFQAAKQLYTLGVGRLVLACRSPEKAEAARQDILAQTPQSNGSQKQIVEVYELDMASTTSISKFVERVARDLDRVDAIVLNAGVDLVSYRKNEPQGYEMTIMVNVIGTFLLAVLMVPVLRKFATEHRMVKPPRISIVGSAVHLTAKYEVLLQAASSDEGVLRWLSDEGRWSGKIGEDRYFLSKAMVQMLVQQLARRISNEGKDGHKPMVVVHALSPGYCRTDLFQESSSVGSRIALKIIGWEADVGGRALVVGAIAERGGEASHGGYMSEGELRQCSSWLETGQGKEVGDKLWAEMLDVVEGVQPGAIALI